MVSIIINNNNKIQHNVLAHTTHRVQCWANSYSVHFNSECVYCVLYACACVWSRTSNVNRRKSFDCNRLCDKYIDCDCGWVPSLHSCMAIDDRDVNFERFIIIKELMDCISAHPIICSQLAAVYSGVQRMPNCSVSVLFLFRQCKY